jgi:tRNA(Ile)-lysidine synthase
MRALMPALAVEGLGARRLAGTAANLARARAALESAAAAVLARAASVHPAGFLWLDPAPLTGAAEEVGLRALARIVMTMGGLEYPPRLGRLRRLYARLAAGLASATTLGGCRFVPRRAGILVVREPAAVETRPVTAGERLLWDGRFAVVLDRGARPRRGGLTLGPLGTAGWAALRAAAPALATAIPPPARPALPALRDDAGVIAVPHLSYQRPGNARLTMRFCQYAPRKSLTTGSFTVA